MKLNRIQNCRLVALFAVDLQNSKAVKFQALILGHAEIRKKLDSMDFELNELILMLPY